MNHVGGLDKNKKNFRMNCIFCVKRILLVYFLKETVIFSFVSILSTVLWYSILILEHCDRKAQLYVKMLTICL